MAFVRHPASVEKHMERENILIFLLLFIIIIVIIIGLSKGHRGLAFILWYIKSPNPPSFYLLNKIHISEVDFVASC